MFYLLYFAFLLPTLETLNISPTSPTHIEAPAIHPLQQDVNGISGNEA